MSNSVAQSQPIQARPRLHVSKPITNCLGRQYTVEDDLWINIVTITTDEPTGMQWIGCSCMADEAFIECPHIPVVEEQEKLYHEQAERREKYVAIFNPNDMEAIYG